MAEIVGEVPILRTAELRDILSGESTETTAPSSQFRLEDIRERWDHSEDDLRAALVSLVEQGEIALFPVGGVVKVRIEQ